MLAALALVALAPAQIQDLVLPNLTEAQHQQLLRGEILVQPLTPRGGSGVAAWAAALVAAPPERVWPVLRDCQHFHEFMPRTKESELVSRDGEVSVCRTRIEMPFPFSDLEARVRSVEHAYPGGGHYRAWTLIEGSYKRNDGAWFAVPYAKKEGQTIIAYRLDVDPDIMVPDAILRSAQTGSLPDAFRAIRKRVASR